MNVWINPWGDAYHCRKGCATRLNKYAVERVPLEEAREDGYEPCGNCKP